jgi:hypothetical protein
MRGLSRKQVSASRGLWVRVPRLPLARMSVERGDRREPSIRVRVPNQNSPVVQWQRLLAYTQATMVRVHPGLLMNEVSRRPKPAGASFACQRHNPATPVLVGEFGRPRHPVTVEIVGSNPIEDAFREGDGTVRKPAKRRSSNLRDLWVRLPLVPMWEGEAPAEPFCGVNLEEAQQDFGELSRVELRPPGTSENNSRRLGIGVPKWL